MLQPRIAFGFSALALIVAAFAVWQEPRLTNIATCSTLVAALALQFHIWCRKPFHPPEERHRRSEMQKCIFRIDPAWKDAAGWDENKGYGDVLVDVLDVPAISGVEKNLYLIPSGYAPKELANTRFLKNDAHLALRRKATEEFVRRYFTKTLTGYYFTMMLPNQGLKVKLYCNELDKILRQHRDDAFKQTRI